MREKFIQQYANGAFRIKGKEITRTLVLFNTSISKSIAPDIIQLGHLGRLLQKKPSYLIIGTGPFGRARVSHELQDYIERQGIRLIIKPTAEACTRYNELLGDGKIVAGFLVHKL